MAEEAKQQGGSGVNVEVVVRCRPLNSQERSEGTPAVVSVTSKHDVCVRQTVGKKRMDKKYAFDRAFGQYATQKEVFEEVVRPIIDEVLEGFNCTVFAYGQTGTGKTHTMEGNMSDPDAAGIIPRSVKAVFKHLEETKSEYSVRLSFLELYNEQLEDLLAKDDSNQRLRIVEDARRGVVCNGLDEVLVHNLEEVQKNITHAINKRKVAETLLNKASSRSHCIFTLTIHKKETTPDGEDLLKVGKLNLVDLAGSECVGRSGAKNKRAREAGNINQSLLTLGRVITALVEHRGHVPYRDSKLTRLLQESLGGRAKTCIIATLSPSVICVDETMSTLDYAHRAKNIKNKPEVNQKMTKRVLLREYSLTIERLRSELQASREKDGVYLPLEQFQQMELNLAGQGSQLSELETVLSDRQKELKELQAMFKITAEELEAARAEAAKTVAQLAETEEVLTETKAELTETKDVLGETEAVLDGHVDKEAALRVEAEQLHATLGVSKKDVSGLWQKIGRKDSLEDHNQSAVTQLQTTLDSNFHALWAHTDTFCTAQSARCANTSEKLREFKVTQKSRFSSLFEAVDDLAGTCVAFQGASETATQTAIDAEAEQWRNTATLAETHGTEVQSTAITGREAVASALSEVKARLRDTQAQVAAMADAFVAMTQATAAAANTFAAAHGEQLTQLQASVTAQLDEAVEGARSQHAAMAEFATSRAAERKAEADKFMNSMQSLMANFLASQQTMTETGVRGFQGGIDATVATLGATRSAVETQVTALSQHASEFASSCAAARDADAAKVKTNLGAIDDTLTATSTQVDAADAVGTQARDAVVTAVGTWKGAVRADAERCTERFTEQAQAQQQAVDEFAAAHKGGVERMQTMVAAGVSESNAFCVDANEQNDAAAQDSSSTKQWVKTWFNESSAVVTEFADSQFKTYEATGETPAKKEYPAPEQLVTPPNREKLVARYRASRLSRPALTPPGRSPICGRTTRMSPASAASPSVRNAASVDDTNAASPAQRIVEVDVDDVALSVDVDAEPMATEPAAPASTRSSASSASGSSALASVANSAIVDVSADGDAEPKQRASRSRIPTPTGPRGRSVGRKRTGATSAARTSRSRSRHSRKPSGGSVEDAPVAGKKAAPRRSSRRRATRGNSGDVFGDTTNTAQE